MHSDPESIAAVRAVLQKFQDGYTRRNPEEVEAFMELFVAEDDLEIIGTSASGVNREEWCLGPEMARELVDSDWRYWGDVQIDVEKANIHALGEAAWLSAPGTVCQDFDRQAQYQNYLEFIQSLLQEKDRPAEEKVLRIQLGCANTVYELWRGEKFTWPFRFTAVLVRREGHWLFHQVQFSFPTTRFPDERILD